MQEAEVLKNRNLFSLLEQISKQLISINKNLEIMIQKNQKDDRSPTVLDVIKETDPMKGKIC